MTERQKQLRDYLRAQQKENPEVGPTQLDMATALKTSPGAIFWLLGKLEQLGEIERGRGWRNIRLREPRQLEDA